MLVRSGLASYFAPSIKNEKKLVEGKKRLVIGGTENFFGEWIHLIHRILTKWGWWKMKSKWNRMLTGSRSFPSLSLSPPICLFSLSFSPSFLSLYFLRLLCPVSRWKSWPSANLFALSSHSILFSSTCNNVGIIILFFSLPPSIFSPLLFFGRSPCLPSSSPLPFRFFLSCPSPQTLIQNEESFDFEMKSRVLLCLKLYRSLLPLSLSLTVETFGLVFSTDLTE